jgi:hypothetical protein
MLDLTIANGSKLCRTAESTENVDENEIGMKLECQWDTTLMLTKTIVNKWITPCL